MAERYRTPGAMPGPAWVEDAGIIKTKGQAYALDFYEEGEAV